MNPYVHDICLVVGLVLVGGGIACYSWPLAAVVIGSLMICLTLRAR
jgi:hypothetical protein